MTKFKKVAVVFTVFAGITLAMSQTATRDPRPRSGPPGAVDPGPRSGQAGAGGFFPTLNASEQAAFANGISQFMEEEVVPDVPPGTGNGGLGPGFNGTSCGSCHAQPATLGSSPAVNPQIAAAKAMGARNQIPSFIQLNGPVREARFVRNPMALPTAACMTCSPLPEERMPLAVL